MTVIDINVGPHRHGSEDNHTLRTNEQLSPFVENLLRQALTIAGDPDGTLTYRVELGEGVATVHMWAWPAQMPEQLRVDLIRGQLVTVTT